MRYFTRFLNITFLPIVASICYVPAASAEDNGTHTLQIEAQPLASALQEFSNQSGLQVGYASEVVVEKTSKGTVGGSSPKEALSRMLFGTGLTYQFVNEDTVVISATDRTRGSGGPGRTGTAPFDAHLMAQVATPQEQDLSSRGAPPVEDKGSASNSLEEIVVTGVRGLPRTVADSPTPIDVISEAELQRTGRAGVFQAIEYLVPSFYLPTRAGGSTSTVIATGGLRGLNPDQALVLVNGKRRHKSSLINAVSSLYNGSVPVDLDFIPVSAVKRIEVLRDGAAAQYGSDAIAGVINIILKNNDEGGTASMSAGQNFDRGDGELLKIAGDVGFQLGESGFLSVFGSAKDQSASDRAIPLSPDLALYYPLPDGSPDPREATINRLVTKNYGVMPSKAVAIGYNAGLPIANGAELELYSFGTFGRRDTTLNWSFREPNDPNNILEVYPDGFYPQTEINETDFDIAFGARGLWGGWHWDASTAYGRNVAGRDVRNTINASLGPASPTAFYVGELESADWTNSVDFTRAFEVSGGDLQVSYGAQHRREHYAVSAGDPGGYEAGDFVFPAGHPRAGQRPAPAAQSNPSIRPADESDAKRDSFAGYGELGWSPNDDLFLGAAARYETYDDSAGDTLVGKLTARYAFSDAFALRSTVSTGFRAPPLAQQQYASTTSQFRDLDGDGVTELLLIKQLPPSSPVAIALGAKPLTPETSTNFSVGFTLEPLDALTVTVDAYQIDLDDRISITSTLSGPEITAILVAAGLSPELSGQYYTNAIGTRTRGLDVVVTYARDLGAGLATFNFGFNKNETEVTSVIANPPELDALGANYELFNRDRRGNLTWAFPDYKGTLGMNWSWKSLNMAARVTHFGPYRTTNNNPAAEIDISAATIADLDVSYQLTDFFKVTLGANNLFNTYPPEIREPSATRGSGQYDSTGGYGFTGGSYYAKVEYSF